MKSFQSLLTWVREVMGLSLDTTHLARSRRSARRSPVSSLPRNSGMAGCTTSPVLSNHSPRWRMRTIRGLVFSETSMVDLLLGRRNLVFQLLGFGVGLAFFLLESVKGFVLVGKVVLGWGVVRVR